VFAGYHVQAYCRVVVIIPEAFCRPPSSRVAAFGRSAFAQKQWARFPELKETVWQGQSMRLVHGHGIPTSLCMCILWDQAHQKRCASVLRPPIIVCVGTTASAGLSVFVTLSIFCWNHVVDMHGRLLKRNSVFWSVWMPAYRPMPTFSKNLAQQKRGASVPQCRMYHRRTSG
jgi:hypothetical protein